jgi:hypothetical protein
MKGTAWVSIVSLYVCAMCVRIVVNVYAHANMCNCMHSCMHQVQVQVFTQRPRNGRIKLCNCANRIIYIYLYIYMYVCIHTYINIYTYIYILHAYAYVCACIIYTYTYVHIYIRTYKYICVHTLANVYTSHMEPTSQHTYVYACWLRHASMANMRITHVVKALHRTKPNSLASGLGLLSRE